MSRPRPLGSYSTNPTMEWIQRARNGAPISKATKVVVGCATVPACFVSTIFTAALVTGVVFFMRHKGLSNRVIIPVAVGTGLTAQVATCVGGMFGFSPLVSKGLHALDDKIAASPNPRVAAWSGLGSGVVSCFGSLVLAAGAATGIAFLMKSRGLTNYSIIPISIASGLAIHVASGAACCVGLTKVSEAAIKRVCRGSEENASTPAHTEYPRIPLDWTLERQPSDWDEGEYGPWVDCGRANRLEILHFNDATLAECPEGWTERQWAALGKDSREQTLGENAPSRPGAPESRIRNVSRAPVDTTLNHRPDGADREYWSELGPDKRAYVLGELQGNSDANLYKIMQEAEQVL